MTVEEVLADLRDRLDKGVKALEQQRVLAMTAARTVKERRSEDDRLSGKVEGLKVVEDWLRAYD